MIMLAISVAGVTSAEEHFIMLATGGEDANMYVK